MGREEPSLDREARGSLCDAVGFFGGCSDITCSESTTERKRKQGIRMSPGFLVEAVG